MPSHKFHIGDSVMLKLAISRNVPGGVYEVIKQLPHNGREGDNRDRVSPFTPPGRDIFSRRTAGILWFSLLLVTRHSHRSIYK
jgi:hypothetical protein